MAIPIVLLYFLKKRKDLPFPKIFLLFAAFIIACGFTHLTEAIIFYYPVYRFLALLLVITAIISWITVFALVPIVPRLLALPSMANLGELVKKDLAATRERLSVAVETLHAGVIDWNTKTDDMVFSELVIDALKLPSKKSMQLASEFFDRVHFEDRLFLIDFINKHIESKEVLCQRFRLVPETNQILNVTMNWKMIFNELQQPVRLVATVVIH